MCGICGICLSDADEEIDVDLLNSMVEFLKHLGPGGGGTSERPRAGGGCSKLGSLERPARHEIRRQRSFSLEWIMCARRRLEVR